MATTGDANSDVNVGEFVEAEEEEGFVDLEAEDLGLHEGERFAVNFDKTFTGFAVCYRGCGLLLAEALYALCRGHAGQINCAKRNLWILGVRRP